MTGTSPCGACNQYLVSPAAVLFLVMSMQNTDVTAMTVISMSDKEFSRLKVLQDVAEHRLKVKGTHRFADQPASPFAVPHFASSEKEDGAQNLRQIRWVGRVCRLHHRTDSSS